MEKKDTTFFGLTSFRNQRKKFGIKRDDRRRHFYTIGKTGMGKSNLMENMAIQDIQNGCGIAYIDPHGEGAEKLLDFIPAERINDVVYFNPADLDFPIAFNVMEKVEAKYIHLVANGLMAVFKKVWPDVWSARMEYILNNTILALLEYPDSTLLGINRMLSDVEYRAAVVANVQDPTVKAFWETEYSRYSQRYETEATAAIQNKVGQFVSNALIRNIIGQTKSTINMRDVMDKEKILILNLSKGRIGEDNSRLLGALLITKIQLAAMSRVDIPEETRRDFYLYVDEFQNFATESFASILSEARKYRLNLIVGHQYIAQMDELVRDAVFGNVGTMAVFRVGAEDAEWLEKEFSPEFTAEDLVNLTKYNIYLKLMIDGMASHPFSANTLPPPIPLVKSNRPEIIESSRQHYAIARPLVEEKIAAWTSGSATGGARPLSSGAGKLASGLAGASPMRTAWEGQGEAKPLFDAVCSSCGKPTKVIFEPKEGRPVYCKSCLKKMKAEKEVAALKFQIPNSKPQALRNFSGQANPNNQIQNPQPQPQPPELSFVEKKAPEPLPVSTQVFVASRKPQQAVVPVVVAHKRKEINLSDLKKAIESSLVKKPSPAPRSIPVQNSAEQARPAVQVQQPTPNPVPKIEEPGQQGVIEPGQKVEL